MDSKETTEIAKEIAADCIAIRVRFVSRVITGLYERALKPFDIKTSQMAMLVLLSVRGESSPTDVGRILRMEKSTVSRNIGRMREKGWLEVTKPAGHPRERVALSQVIRITPKGAGLLAALHGEWAKAQDAARTLLGEEGLSSVRGLYDSLRGR